MTNVEQLLTGEEVLKMPREMTSGYELIEGILVPRREGEVATGLKHARVEGRVTRSLGNYLDTHPIGEVYPGEPGFYTRGNTQTYRAADVAYISYERLPKDADIEGFSHIAPELVVEIISPGNSAENIDAKILECLNFGVRIVWVIYPETQRVYVFESAQSVRIFGENDTLEAPDILPGFQLQFRRLFE